MRKVRVRVGTAPPDPHTHTVHDPGATRTMRVRDPGDRGASLRLPPESPGSVTSHRARPHRPGAIEPAHIVPDLASELLDFAVA